MRRDELCLRDIIEAAHNIAEDIAGMGREDFLGKRTVRDAVVRNLTVIGEACARISLPFRERCAEIPWPDVIAFRPVNRRPKPRESPLVARAGSGDFVFASAIGFAR